MPDIDPNEFTEREKFIISYYRSAELSSLRRLALYDSAVIIVSIACMVMLFIQEDAGYGFVGYALLISRLVYLTLEGGRWNRDFHNIFVKYDAKLKAATETRKTERQDDVT